MIFLDIESSGADRLKHNMVSLGAILPNGTDFYGECRLYDNEPYTELALEINGFTKDEIFDKTKQTRWELYQKFEAWALENTKDFTLCGLHVGTFDAIMLRKAFDNSITFDRMWPFGYRFIDLHSISFYLFGETLTSDGICDRLSLPKEERPHNALTGAKHAKLMYEAMMSYKNANKLGLKKYESLRSRQILSA